MLERANRPLSDDRRLGSRLISHAAPEDSRLKRSAIRMVEHLSGRRRLAELAPHVLPITFAETREAVATRASVLPVHVAGQNSRLFDLASHIHPTFRLSLLMREAARRIGSTVQVDLRPVVPYATLASLGEPRRVTSHLQRLACGVHGFFTAAGRFS